MGRQELRPEKIILRKKNLLKSLTLFPLWVASFLPSFLPNFEDDTATVEFCLVTSTGKG